MACFAGLHGDGEQRCGLRSTIGFAGARNRYPGDLQDAEWARLEPLIRRRGRPRKTDMQAAMNTILYTGSSWRYMPCDRFPPRSTVYNFFESFSYGVWEAIWAEFAHGCARTDGPGGESFGDSTAAMQI